MAQFFHDPRREQDVVIFIDARDDEHYGRATFRALTILIGSTRRIT